jgi:hypothetical protein
VSSALRFTCEDHTESAFNLAGPGCCCLLRAFIAPPRALWRASTGWDTAYDGCMREGVLVRGLECCGASPLGGTRFTHPSCHLRRARNGGGRDRGGCRCRSGVARLGRREERGERERERESWVGRGSLTPAVTCGVRGMEAGETVAAAGAAAASRALAGVRNAASCVCPAAAKYKSVRDSNRLHGAP